MLFWILPLLLSCIPDVPLLGNEDWATREAAHARMATRGPFALPALKMALRSDDVEIRYRAGTLYTQAARPAQEQEVARLALWLLYAPDDVTDPCNPEGVTLDETDAIWACTRPDVLKEVGQLARAHNLLEYGGQTFYWEARDTQEDLVLWYVFNEINILRHRARNMPFPGNDRD